MEQIRKKLSEMDQIVHFRTAAIETLDNTSKEHAKRLTSAEKTVEDLVKARIELLQNKCELSSFESESKDVRSQLKKMQEELSSNKNHCQTLENYIEKY